MKLQSLHIQNIRGAPKLDLTFNGKNKVIFGDNGSGKSTIVEALDLLLTGEIRRFKGKGTGNLSKNRHGVHLTSTIEDAVVSATFDVDGENIEIIRKLNGELEINVPEDHQIYELLKHAENGSHMLSRKEVLSFIHAIPSTRSKDIQNLLNLKIIEDNREELVRIKNHYKNEKENREGDKNREINRLTGLLELDKYSDDLLLDKVNFYRDILEAEEIDKADSDLIQIDIDFSTISANIKLDFQIYAPFFDKLLSEESYEIISNFNTILESIEQLKGKDSILKHTNKMDLVETGLSLVTEDSTECPLCGKSWEDNLLEYLKKRKAELQEINKDVKALDQVVKQVYQKLDNMISDVNEILKLSKIKQLEFEFDPISNYNEQLEAYRDKFQNLENFLSTEVDDPDQILNQLPVDKLEKLKEYAAEQLPELDEPQKALNMLSEIKSRFVNYQDRQKDHRIAQKKHKLMKDLYAAFVTAKDKEFDALFSSIAGRFSDFYNQLHQGHEDNFDAELKSTDASIEFEVSYLDQGKFPPNAIHSEGHQDSMGVSLFLALNEYLNQGKIDFVILDDVVHSVDRNHRKNLCKLLKQEFPDTQFIITTHDQLWAQQLQKHGVITSKHDQIQLYDWELGSGPKISFNRHFWDDVDDYLNQNKINEAAAKLRRGLEQFFFEVGEQLAIKVRLNSDARWSLGELYFNSYSKLRSTLMKAKKSANSWDRSELEQEIEDLLDELKEKYTNTQAEYWTVNLNVHYNPWADFTLKELRETKEAFEEICPYFECKDCNSSLYISTVEFEEQNLRCKCGKTNYNLIKKPN